jgi:hypothetical protein
MTIMPNQSLQAIPTHGIGTFSRRIAGRFHLRQGYGGQAGLDDEGDGLLPGFVAASFPAPVPELWRSATGMAL